MTAIEHVVSARLLQKHYGQLRALGGVSLDVERATVFGLLGQNGAGKTTLIKILLGMLAPTAGSAHLLGRPVGSVEARRDVGYLPEDHRLPEYHTGPSLLDVYGGLQGLARRERRHRAAELLELLGLAGRERLRIRGYSKGMKQRLGLAQALLHRPSVLFLDEPTDGVDPVGRREIRDVLLRMRAEGRTVFLNSHLLGEVELVCDRVAIMLKGKVERQGTMAELTHDSRAWRVTIEGAAPAWCAEFGVVTIDGTRGSIDLKSDELAILQSLIDRLRSDGHAIIGVRETRESLEDLFMRLVRDVDGRTAAVGASNVNSAMRAGGAR